MEHMLWALPQKDDSTNILLTMNLFCISNLRDVVIDFLLCLDMLNSLLVFVQRFYFSLPELFHLVQLICFQNFNNFYGQEKKQI